MDRSEQKTLKQIFIDYSKTEEGQQIFEENSKFWVDGNFQKHIKSLNDLVEIELAQILRKYQSSFVWIKLYFQKSVL